MRKDLILYLASRVSAGTGLTLLRAAVAWHLYALTGSAFDLGLMGAVQLLPALGLSLPAGVLIDRFDRPRIIQIAQLLQFAATVVLTVCAARDVVTPTTLYAAVAFTTACAAFANPARAALLPQLVAPRDLLRAVTFASSSQALAFTLGPAVAGLMLAALPIAYAYAFGGALVLLSVLSLAGLTARPATKRGAVGFAGMLDGLKFVCSNPVVLGAMSLDLFAVILGGASALLPIFAHDVLRVGPRGFGALSAALEIGALVTATVLLLIPPVKRAGRALLVAVAVYGAATIVFGASTSFALSLVAYAVAGMADQVSVVLRQTTIQLQTPDALRGRVSAVGSIFIGASNQLSAVEAGFVAAATSAPFAVVSGGVGVLCVVSVVAIALPTLRQFRFETPDRPAA